MAPQRRTPRNSSGQQIARNAIGAAENALLLAELVKNFLDKGVTPELRQKATSILTTMGGTQGLTTSLNMITADHATEEEPPQLGSAIRAAYSSGGSATTGSRFNDTPIPIDLTGSLSACKRRATQVVDIESDEDLAQFEEPASRTRDGIPTTPRPLPAVGGTQGLTTGLDMIIGEQSPELAPSSINSVLRAAHAGRSGSSSSTSKKFNDKPIPIDLTGPLGGLNAPTKPPTSALPVIPWQWQAAPSIIKDFIAFGNGCRAIYTLICADEAMVLLTGDAAQMLRHLLFILRKKTSQSLPLSVAAYMAGIGKSLVMSLDMPLLIPYPGATAMASYVTSISDISIFNNMDDARVLARDTPNFMNRKAIFSLVIVDETMVSMDNRAAQTFCALLLSLRKKILPSLPLSAVARIAGVDKSLIISIDMPLYIPNPDSTAMASYVSSITGIGFFANDADTRQLARDTASSMRAQGWKPTARLPVQFQRETTQAEGRVPMEVVADRLTHLGEARKPLMTINTWKRPQVISAGDVRNLSWENRPDRRNFSSSMR
ncbi:hypothetical protein FPANT_10053 [Fusarium pseudoanthophilum]|uniref:Uncharacterized protein n=1 Tax=Fusarium pseudoanthophilum TaxID=48495 RepID=A0A8H5KUN2_9HYPO|nr:hypothetical protein FPANT_10053 [Fusarium pseudoanthophilum]